MTKHGLKKSSILSGLLAGAMAGTLMLASLSLGGYFNGNSIWEPTARIAGVWFGAEALGLEAKHLIAGVFTHLFASTLLGGIFGLITQRIKGTSTEIVAGMFYATLIWSVGTYLLLPLVDPFMFSFALAEEGFWFFSHMIYGFTLGACAPLKRWMGARWGGQCLDTPVRRSFMSPGS